MKFSLSLKISLSLIFALFIVMSIFTYLDVSSTRLKMENEEQKNTATVFLSAIPVVENALWNLDSNVISTAILQMFRYPTIEYVGVFNENGSVFSSEGSNSTQRLTIESILHKKELNELTGKTKLVKESRVFQFNRHSLDKVILVTKLNIIEEGQDYQVNIGYLLMEYSTFHISQQINKSINKIIFLFISLGLVVFTVCFLIINKLVIVPLKSLEHASIRIANYDFTEIKPRKLFFGEDELDHLTTYFNFMIKQFLEFIEEQKNQQRIVIEFEMSRVMQESLLPKAKKLRVGHFEISSYYKSASECGGDFWHFYPLNDKKILLMVGDVTGHGMPSALLTAAVKGYCDSIYSRYIVDPSVILEELDVLIRQNSDFDRCMTMFVAIIDPILHSITYSNAGHNFPLLLKPSENGYNVKSLLMSGKRLGYRELDSTLNEKKYKLKTEKIDVGNILFLYTDGIIDALNENGDIYTEKRLKNNLRSMAASDTDYIVNFIEKDLENFNGNKMFADDVTFMACLFCEDEDNSYNNELINYFRKK